jgi:carbon-monoxide dehydrogenase small subunit
MTINFILNGEDVAVQTNAETRLIDILRDNFGLLGAKSGCLAGKCGMCTVIFKGLISPACLIPAFRIRGSEIITIEGFSQTDEYQDIVSGFNFYGAACGCCQAAKILCTEALLERNLNPAREEILLAFGGIRCRCTNSETLLEAVKMASVKRQQRVYGRTS